MTDEVICESVIVVRRNWDVFEWDVDKLNLLPPCEF